MKTINIIEKYTPVTLVIDKNGVYNRIYLLTNFLINLRLNSNIYQDHLYSRNEIHEPRQ